MSLPSSLKKELPTDSVEDGIKLMVYGHPGVGKTRLLGTANDDPRTSPVVWIDLEGGTRTIKSKVRRLESIRDLGEPKEGLIDVIRVEDFKAVQEVYNWLFEAKYEKKRLVYKSLVIDSLTEINQVGLRHAMIDNPQVVRLDLDVPEQRDYLKTNAMMKRFLRALRDLEDFHVFYSALPQVRENDEGGLAYLKPALIGKLADEAVAIMEFVGYMKAKVNGERELIFQPEGRIIAKERSEDGAWIKKLTNPTMTQILNAIYGVK